MQCGGAFQKSAFRMRLGDRKGQGRERESRRCGTCPSGPYIYLYSVTCYLCAANSRAGAHTVLTLFNGCFVTLEAPSGQWTLSSIYI